MSIRRSTSSSGKYRYKAMVLCSPDKFMKSKTRDRREDALADERQLIRARDEGLGSDCFAPLPFSERIWCWHEDIKKRGCSAAHIENVRNQISKQFVPFFKDKNLKRIKPSDVSTFVSHLMALQLSSITVNAYLGALKSFFSFEIEEGNVLKNPVLRKHRLLETPSHKEIWFREETDKFLNYTSAKYHGEDRWIFLLYKIALNSGMRFGEIIALTKSDVDWANSRIIISKAYCSVSLRIKSPKNGQTRYAPLSTLLAAEMRDYFASHKVLGPLFTTPDGSYRSYNSIRKIYLNDMKSAGVKVIRFHSFRRCFVSSWIQNGGDLATLRKCVGHADFEVMNSYNVLSDDLKSISEIVNV